MSKDRVAAVGRGAVEQLARCEYHVAQGPNLLVALQARAGLFGLVTLALIGTAQGGA